MTFVLNCTNLKKNHRKKWKIFVLIFGLFLRIWRKVWFDIKSRSNENASNRKLACDDLRLMPPVKRRHKSSQVLNFRQWTLYIVSYIRVHWLPLVPMLLQSCGEERFASTCQRTPKLSQVEKNLRWNLSKLKLVASSRKPPQVGGQTSHKQAQAKTCVLAFDQGLTLHKMSCEIHRRCTAITDITRHLIPNLNVVKLTNLNRID